MIAAFLACVLSQTKVVTLDSPGWSVPQILAEISKQTGQDFEAKDDVRNDHVIVHVDHVPIKDFMDRFGAALLSAWTQQDSAYVLQRSPSLVAESEATTRKSLALRIAATLSEFTKSLGRRPAFDPAYARSFAEQVRSAGTEQNPNYYSRIQTIKEGLPLYRALKEMVVSLGPEALAGIPFGKRVVFSTQPNALQLALPASSTKILTSAIKEEDVWQKATAGIKTGEWLESMIDFRSYQGAVGAILALKQDPLNSGITVDLSIFNKAGIVLGTSNLEIGTPPIAKSMGDKLSGLNESGTPVAIDADTADGLKTLSLFGGKSKPGADIYNRILHPVEYDPLSMFASGCLKALGVQQSENVIAYGDTGLLFSFAPYSPKAKFDTSWITSPSTTFMESAVEEQGWLTAVPNDFDGYLAMRTNRTALEELLAPNASAGWVPVDAAAQFIASENLQTPDLFSLLLAQVCYGTSGCPLDPSNWAFEGVYGMLQPDQVAKAMGGGLSVSMLTPTQQKALLDGLMNQTIRFGSFGPRSSGVEPGQASRPLITTTEPTLAFAHGLPPGMTLLVKKTGGPCILCDYGARGENGSGAPGNASTIAWNIFMSKHKPEMSVHYFGYRPGFQEKLDLDILWPNGNAAASFQSSGASGPLVKNWKQLPPGDVAEIEKQLANYEKQFKQNPNMISGQGYFRQGTPP